MSKTSALPDAGVHYEFEHCTVNYSCEHSLATNRNMPRLSVQAIDAYGYQREFSVSFHHEPGDSSKLLWEMRVYCHPGRRESEVISESVAKRFISRFLDLCDRYPSLLFNATGEHETNKARPRSEGFIHLCERLHRGEALSVNLL